MKACWAGWVFCCVAAPSAATAADGLPSCDEVASERMRGRTVAPDSGSELTQTTAPRPLVVNTMVTATYGRGIRFNNPYRLATPLGRTAESLSWTAPYLDVSWAGTLGRGVGPGHGLALHVSVALDGVSQQVLTPGYLQLWRLGSRWMLMGRAGIPVVAGPEPTWGFEGGVAGAWLVASGIGIVAEGSGSLFYGAATPERPVTTIPIVSVQIGVLFDYEVIR